jgi:hypothetical protein
LRTCELKNGSTVLLLPTDTICTLPSNCINLLHIKRITNLDQSINQTPSNPPITPPTMSGFLTFSRRALGTTTRNTTTLIKPLAAQPFSSAASRQASGETEGKNPDSTHATRKKDQLDVQSANSKEAQE